MGNILTAAQDPIFWLHHANIDRLWSVWSETSGHIDPAESKWRGHSFEFFDKNGHKVAMKCEEVLATVADLGYSYDTSAGQAPVAAAVRAPSVPAARASEAAPLKSPEPQLIGATEKSFELHGAAVSVDVLIDADAAETLSPSQNVYLNVEDIEGETNPGTVYGVYADLPEDAPAELEASITSATSLSSASRGHEIRRAMSPPTGCGSRWTSVRSPTNWRRAASGPGTSLR